MAPARVDIPQSGSYGSGKTTTVEEDPATGDLLLRAVGYYEDDVRIPRAALDAVLASRKNEAPDRAVVACEAEPFAWVIVMADGVVGTNTYRYQSTAQSDCDLFYMPSAVVVPLHRPIDAGVAAAMRLLPTVAAPALSLADVMHGIGFSTEDIAAAAGGAQPGSSSKPA